MAQKYIVYDDGGYHLELPFFQREGPAQEPEDFRVAVEPAASQPEETPEEGEPLLAAVTVPPFSGGGRLGGRRWPPRQEPTASCWT